MNAADRPRIHLTPLVGWLNDPNAITFRGGLAHAFFQFEPDVPRWGLMRWGHAVSRDLLTWKHLPIALEPSADGPDSAGCWSGCLVDSASHGAPTIFYTGVVVDGGIRRASICSATGDPELIDWTKVASGPVLTGPPSGIRPDTFRDPFVWRDDQGWAMLIGAGTTTGRGRVLLYRSDDLRQWRYVGPFLTMEELIASCPGLDAAEVDSSCWECPQLAMIGEVAVLILSIVDRSPVVRPAHVVAVSGHVEHDRFVPAHAERLGLGPDFYAPSITTTPDGRVLMLGWIPEDPPRPRALRSWAGAMTLPRVVSVDAEGRPLITLADEVSRVGEPVTCWTDVDVTDAVPWSIDCPGGHVDVRLSLESDRAAPLRIDVLAGGQLVAEVRFDPRTGRLAASRIGRVLVAGREPTGATTLPPAAAASLELRLILDGSILEVVAADRVTATVRLPTVRASGRTLSFSTFGGSCRVARAELDVIPPIDARRDAIP